MKREAFLFDMDGVLLDSEYEGFSFMKKKLETRGIEIPFHVLLGKIGKTTPQIAEELINEYKIKETPDEFMEKNRQSSYYSDYPVLQPMPGLISFLNQLSFKKMHIGVVSSTNSRSVLYALNRLNLIKYVETIVCGDMVHNPKPDPECYLKAAKWLGVHPDQCVVVEDSPIGIRAGKRAGMYVIGYEGSSVSQDTSEADYICKSFVNCIDYLDRLTVKEM